jgi:hypothetical protein
MTKHFLASSNINYAAYDFETEVLEIGFHSGALYRYKNVPMSEYHTLLDPPATEENPDQSHGVYFNKHIKGHYKFVRIK